jgi:2-keto-3-deoxy-L-rhamnonate aldolase RhmA
VKNLRKRVLAGETLFGCFLNLGSSLTAEIVGMAGFDWALIDLEHGAGFESHVLHQLQALEHTAAAALVRVESSQRQRLHRVLDLGAHGIMVPRVSNKEEAMAAVRGLRYPPQGVRGVASMNRACEFGARFRTYVSEANASLLGIVQIETEESLHNLDAIAETDGVDVLFLGPLDLSHGLGVAGQFDHPRFLEAVQATVAAAQRHGKAAGTLIGRPEDLLKYTSLGYRFIGCGSDGGLLNSAARVTVAALRSAAKRG